MEHRRLMILFAAIILFAFGVIVWYFLFSKPEPAPTLDEPTPAFSLRDLPARFGFIFQDDPVEQTTETEVTLPGEQPFIRVWEKPSTGNVFVNRSILREVTATTTVGTSTAVATRTVRATTTVLMFVDRITGYVYGHNIESGQTYQISNTTIPGVYDAYIWNGGDRVLMRYLSSDRRTVLSLVATIPNVQEGRDPQPLTNSTNLPQGISSVAVSQNLSKLSYIVPNDIGASVYTLSGAGASVKIADSPFSEWNLFYGGEALYAHTKPSAYVKGITVSLPSFSRVIGEKTGLVSVGAPNGILLSNMWSRSGLLLFGSQNGVIETHSTRTLAEKCTHMVSSYFLCGVPKALPRSEEGLPDDWYQGRVSFGDSLFMIDAVSGTSEYVYEADSTHGPMDMVSLASARGGELVSFIRKQDGSLFLLNTRLLE
jgi:hypothetical protein